MLFLFAVPRRGASCYEQMDNLKDKIYRLLSPAGARVVTVQADGLPDGKRVAVPHRGTSCYRLYSGILQENSPVAVPRRGASCYRTI